MFDPAGEECDLGNAIRQIDARDVIGVQATAGPENGCEADGAYLVTVSRRLADERATRRSVSGSRRSRRSRTPASVSGAEPEIVAPVVPGAAAARHRRYVVRQRRALTTGKWSGTVVPGEAQMFSFALDFGQSAQVRVRVPAGLEGAA